MSIPINPVVLIPARLASSRFPLKPLAKIAGKPMIVWVLERALTANIGPVFVACDNKKILDTVNSAGGEAVMTDPNHPSGSDRIFEALNLIDPTKAFDTVVNLQGDLPTIESSIFRSVLKPLADKEVDIATLVAEIESPHTATSPNIVKAIISLSEGKHIGRALYFTRALAPSGFGPLFHHIGVYAYRREALKQFVNLPQTILEKREQLEQLRALEAGMRIDACRVDTVPIGVDTPEDLKLAQKILEKNHE